MIEEWKDIKGYKGLYQVSNTGKVRRRSQSRRHNRHKERVSLYKGIRYYIGLF